jgi:hybrid cluster-associated redox disulfide protein
MGKITKETPLKDIISQYPQAAAELGRMGLGCIGCFAAQFETLEQGVKAHGMDIDDVLKKLNALVE